MMESNPLVDDMIMLAMESRSIEDESTKLLLLGTFRDCFCKIARIMELDDAAALEFVQDQLNRLRTNEQE